MKNFDELAERVEELGRVAVAPDRTLAELVVIQRDIERLMPEIRRFLEMVPVMQQRINCVAGYAISSAENGKR